ncbi:MAG: hypothetical protein JSW66_14650 [Phycisphaerales bacterium]|nr:MAG: hypothetical protein JSW66_14650 [Phycisphaerales bacterium]
MKKTVIASLIVVMVLSIVVVFAGNGAPKGAHFNLNIIGVKHEKNVDKNGGHVIFVPLDTSKHTSRTGLAGKVDILLVPTDDGTFAVLDGNATDGEGAFAMPRDVATTYTVWVRGLGKPNGEAHMQLAAYDDATSSWLYSTNEIKIKSHGNNNKFMNVSSDLFFLADGTAVFDPVYEDYLWTYGNNGLKLAQLRFYPVD